MKSGKTSGKPNFYIETEDHQGGTITFGPDQIAEEVEKGSKFGRDFKKAATMVVKRMKKIDSKKIK